MKKVGTCKCTTDSPGQPKLNMRTYFIIYKTIENKQKCTKRRKNQKQRCKNFHVTDEKSACVQLFQCTSQGQQNSIHHQKEKPCISRVYLTNSAIDGFYFLAILFKTFKMFYNARKKRQNRKSKEKTESDGAQGSDIQR